MLFHSRKDKCDDEDLPKLEECNQVLFYVKIGQPVTYHLNVLLICVYDVRECR